jgi:hypothetical protein
MWNMPIRQLFVVTIEFAGAAPFVENPQPERGLGTRYLRLVEKYSEISRSFTLYGGNELEYKLSVEETEQLDQLLRQMDVKAPWQSYTGFDGTDYELTLLGAMSSVTFRWWVKAPAEWEQVGAVFDYVLAVAERCQSE